MSFRGGGRFHGPAGAAAAGCWRGPGSDGDGTADGDRRGCLGAAWSWTGTGTATTRPKPGRHSPPPGAAPPPAREGCPRALQAARLGHRGDGRRARCPAQQRHLPKDRAFRHDGNLLRSLLAGRNPGAADLHVTGPFGRVAGGFQIWESGACLPVVPVAALSVSGHCPTPVHSAVGAQHRRAMAPEGGGRREPSLVSGLAAAVRVSRPAGRRGPARHRIAWRGRVPR